MDNQSSEFRIAIRPILAELIKKWNLYNVAYE